MSASGNEGAQSAQACVTTLPQLQAFLDLDLSLADQATAAYAASVGANPFGDLTGDGVVDAVIMVKAMNLLPINGYQFSYSIEGDAVDVLMSIDGTTLQYSGCINTATAGGHPDPAAACAEQGYQMGLVSPQVAPPLTGVVMAYPSTNAAQAGVVPAASVSYTHLTLPTICSV